MSDGTLDFINMSVRLTDDPIFVHREDTFKALSYIFLRHLNIWITLHERYNDINSLMDNNLNLDAGLVYNVLFVTSNGDKELTGQQFDTVCTSFAQFIERNKGKLKIAHQLKNITDPRDLTWAACHHFFVPVRLQDHSIPKHIRDISLRKWLSVIFVLPFMRPYSGKFSRVINNVEFVNGLYDRLVNEPEKIKHLMNIAKDEFFLTLMGPSYATKSSMCTFVRIFMHLVLYCSLEIMKKYNPVFLECVRINPKYDGTWINPFDQLFNEQYNEITKLSELVIVKNV